MERSDYRAQVLEPRTEDEEQIYEVKTPGGKGVPVETFRFRKVGKRTLRLVEYKKSPSHKEATRTYEGRMPKYVVRAVLAKWGKMRRLEVSDDIDGVDRTFIAVEMEFNRPEGS